MNKSLFIFVCVVIGLFLIGGVAYVAMHKSKSITSAGPVTQAPAVVDSAPATSEHAPIPGWKTYKNESYGFEFQYPSNLIIYSERDRVIVFDTPETKKLFEAKSLSRIGDLIIYVDPNPQGLSAEAFYNRPDSFFKNPTTIKVGNNISAYEVADPGTSVPRALYVSIPADKNFIEFNNYLDKSILDQILSTFKFI